MTIEQLAERGIYVDLVAGTVEVHLYTAAGDARGFDPAWLAEASAMVSPQ